MALCRDTIDIPDYTCTYTHRHVCLLAAGHVEDPARSDEHKDGEWAWVSNENGSEAWLSSERVSG